MSTYFRSSGYLVFCLSLIHLGCQGGDGEARLGEPLFVQISAQESGVDFANMIRQDLEINVVSFEYLMNGAGVSIGDVDGDDLPDIYLIGTQRPNRLYRNLGDFKFEDITEQAGVAGRDSSISTGSTMADVDGDGDLDIYVCNTGHPDWSIDRRNQLFINDGSGVFTESAEAFGLDSESYSNHATFFDY